MKRRNYSSLWMIPAGIGAIFGLFFFFVQENIYSGPNNLFSVSEFFNHQTSATSLFAILCFVAQACYFSYVLDAMINKNLNILRFFGILIGGSLYTLYEILQSRDPTYPDNHILDIKLAWIGVFILMVFWLIIAMKEKKDKLI